MKLKPNAVMMIVGLFVYFLFATSSMAAEILTVEDFKKMVVTKEQLVKTADNAIILFDASSSMARPYLKTGRSMYEVAVEELKAAGERLPEMGHNIGVYIHSRWQPVYPMQTFNRNKFAAALQSFPANPEGPTLLMQGLIELEPILQQLSGKTVVFIFTDGMISQATGIKEPRVKAKELAEKYDVCFYLISSADKEKNRKMLKDLAGINACSRLIPFEAFVGRPEYNSGALYLVKATEDIVTLSDRKVVGLKADNILFKFNQADLQSQYSRELDEVAMFLQKKPRAYVVIEGYTDNIGSVEYNMELSRRRAESVSNYLMQKHDVQPSEIVMNWYAYTNPIANNDTAEGRAQNRRVEVAVGVLD